MTLCSFCCFPQFDGFDKNSTDFDCVFDHFVYVGLSDVTSKLNTKLVSQPEGCTIEELGVWS